MIISFFFSFADLISLIVAEVIEDLEGKFNCVKNLGTIAYNMDVSSRKNVWYIALKKMYGMLVYCIKS